MRLETLLSQWSWEKSLVFLPTCAKLVFLCVALLLFWVWEREMAFAHSNHQPCVITEAKKKLLFLSLLWPFLNADRCVGLYYWKSPALTPFYLPAEAHSISFFSSFQIHFPSRPHLFSLPRLFSNSHCFFFFSQVGVTCCAASGKLTPECWIQVRFLVAYLSRSLKVKPMGTRTVTWAFFFPLGLERVLISICNLQSL